MAEEIRDYCRRGSVFNDKRDTGDLVVSLATSAVNLYGVVTFEELQSLVDRYMFFKGKKKQEHLWDLEFMTCVLHGRESCVDVAYFIWKDWICHPEFATEKKHMDELIRQFVSERDEHERWYPKDIGEFLPFEDEYSFLDMPECERLEAFLKKCGFENEDERIETLMNAVQQLQIESVRPGVIMQGIIEKCTIPTRKEAQEFCNLWMDFGNNLHRRVLNGETPTMAWSKQKKVRPPVITVDPRSDIGRNELCPCGSGKKFKKCCGKKAKQRAAADALASDRLSVYLPMRELTMKFVAKCVMPLCTEKMFCSAAERVGISLSDIGMAGNRDTLFSVIGDYAVMMDDSFGDPPIKRLIADAGKFTGDRLRALDMYRQYRYTWLKILDVEPGVGLKCRDLLTGEEGFMMETSLSRSYFGYGMRDMTICAGIGTLPNGTWMALGSISPIGFDNPEAVLRIVLSYLGISWELPVRLSFADQARFAAETIKRIHVLGRYSDIKYGGCEQAQEDDDSV